MLIWPCSTISLLASSMLALKNGYWRSTGTIIFITMAVKEMRCCDRSCTSLRRLISCSPLQLKAEVAWGIMLTERTMVSAMALRRPFIGVRRWPSVRGRLTGAAVRFTGAAVCPTCWSISLRKMRPLGPVPLSWPSSTPISRAYLRVLGAARAGSLLACIGADSVADATGRGSSAAVDVGDDSAVGMTSSVSKVASRLPTAIVVPASA